MMAINADLSLVLLTFPLRDGFSGALIQPHRFAAHSQAHVWIGRGSPEDRGPVKMEEFSSIQRHWFRHARQLGVRQTPSLS